MVSNYKEAKLKPLSLKVTPRQFDRLLGLRAYDALSVQEHARRALDAYLDIQERKIGKEAQIETAVLATVGAADQVSANQARQPIPPVAPANRNKVGSRPYQIR